MNTVQGSKATHQEFGIHPSIIYTLITAQASGIEKALLELVMNSVDAQATRIDVELNQTGFVVKDNGIGFENREKIKTCFGILGFPHDEGDAYYGKFRLGRMQSFGYAKTTWHTKNYKIMVDLNIAPEIESYGYEIHEVPEFHQGCIITGEFYQKMEQCNPDVNLVPKKILSPYSIKNAVLALAVSVKYLPVDIYINGERVNKRQEELMPTAEIKSAQFYTEEISRDSNEDHVINVYNKGVYAFSIPTHLLTGDVVSTQPIDLNMARNEAKSTCKVYRAIVNKIDRLNEEIFSGRNQYVRSIGDDINIQQYAQNFWSKFLGINGDTFESPKEFSGLLKYKWFKTPADETVSYLDVASTIIHPINSSYRPKAHFLKLYSIAEVNEYDILPAELDQISCMNCCVPLEMMPNTEFLKHLPETISFPIDWLFENLDYLADILPDSVKFEVEIPFGLSLEEKSQKLISLLCKVCCFLSLAISMEHDLSMPSYKTGFQDLTPKVRARYVNFSDLKEEFPELSSYHEANQDGTYSQALRLYLLNRIPENFSQIDSLAEFIYEPVRISKQFFENLQSKIHSQKKLKLSPFQESILTQLKNLVRIVEKYQNKLIGEFDSSKPLSEEMRQSMFLTHRKIYLVGMDENILGQTDSSNYILINQKYFVECIQKNDFSKLYYLVLHEMAHGCESQSHVHGEVFYSKFHGYLMYIARDFGVFESQIMEQVLMGKNFKSKKCFEKFGASKANVEYFLNKYIRSTLAVAEY